MDDAFAMRHFQRRDHLPQDLDGFLWRVLPALLEQVRKILPFDELHGDEPEPIGDAEIENADYIPMRDLAGENQLLLESRENTWMAREFAADHFQSDQAVQLAVASLIDRPHPAFAEQL